MKNKPKGILNKLSMVVIFILIVSMTKLLNGIDEKNTFQIEFKEFQESLQGLNKNISEILVINNISINNRPLVIDENSMDTFPFVRIAERITTANNDYIYMYNWEVIPTINKILSDGKITKSERNYLETLYDYSEELILSYNDIFYNSIEDIDNPIKSTFKIKKLYKDYAKKASELFRRDKYAFLKDYKGDFENFNYEEVEKYCKDISEKLNITLEFIYNNKDKSNLDKFELRTAIGTSSLKYGADYDKNTKEISVMALQYSGDLIPLKDLEDSLDKRSKEIIEKFNLKAELYKREIKYDGSKKKKVIDRIEYSYIEKKNGMYDESTKINFTITSSGLLTDFYMAYPLDEEMPMPMVSKEEVVKKINKDAEITNIYTVRNIKGELEYEVQLKYGQSNYAAVYSAYTGEFKHYSENSRNYTDKT